MFGNQKMCKNITSVESDEKWYEKIKYETVFNETKKQFLISWFQKEMKELKCLEEKNY